MSTATKLITAEEYARLPDPGVPTELVRGEIVEMNVPDPQHGEFCSNAGWLLEDFVKKHGPGRVGSNDARIVAERDPDTVRGGDVSFISHSKVPKGSLPAEHLEIPPDNVVEVKSVFDRWKGILGRVAEYLSPGVAVVCVLEPETETVRLYDPRKPEVVLTGDQAVTFPNELPGFSVAAKSFFE